MRQVPDNNLSAAVLLEIGNSTGSGFYFRTDKKIFLVTAKHVLFGKNSENEFLFSKFLKLTSYDKDLSKKQPLEHLVDLSLADIRKNDTRDIVLVELANISPQSHKVNFCKCVQKISSQGGELVVVNPGTLKKFDDVLISNDAFIIGFPISLGTAQQIEEKRPLLRKGIIAGKNHKLQTIILDCPVYFGNSGGIAIEIEEVSGGKRISVIGIVSEYIPFIEELKSKLGYTNLNFENSGYSVVVPIDTILDLTKETPITSDNKPIK